MKAHWKLIVGLVIGVLVAGQAVSLRYVMAGGQELDHAAKEVAICHNLQDRAGHDYQDLMSNVNAIRKTSLSPTDQRIVLLIYKSAAVQKDLMDTDSHAIAAVDLLLQHNK